MSRIVSGIAAAFTTFALFAVANASAPHPIPLPMVSTTADGQPILLKQMTVTATPI